MDNAVVRFVDALNRLCAASADGLDPALLDALQARDALASRIAEAGALSAEDLLAVKAADARLRAILEKTPRNAAVVEFRAMLERPTSSWWWYPPAWDRVTWTRRLDPLWTAVTAALLALAGSFMFAIFQSYSANGISWTETFATVLQGLGLALLGRGAVTRSGQEQMSRLLGHVGISAPYRARTLLLVSAAVCGLSWAFHSHWLPEAYMHWGSQAYEKGELVVAKAEFSKVIALAGPEPDAQLALGQVHESIGELDKAISLYQDAVISGLPTAFNHLGRVYTYQTGPQGPGVDLPLAESLLRLGMQRAAAAYPRERDWKERFDACGKCRDNQRQQCREGDEAICAQVGAGTCDEIPDPDLCATVCTGVSFPDPPRLESEYQLIRNLGWVSMEQGQLTQAQALLELADDIDASIPCSQLGTNMASCLLYRVRKGLLEEQEAAGAGRSEALEREALRALSVCIEGGRPETIAEYQWIVTELPFPTANCVDTSSVMRGLHGELPSSILGCQAYLEALRKPGATLRDAESWGSAASPRVRSSATTEGEGDSPPTDQSLPRQDGEPT